MVASRNRYLQVIGRHSPIPTYRFLGCSTVALIGFLLLWPLVSHYSVIHDEHRYTIMAISGKGFFQNLVEIWQSGQYRVLDLISGYLCNPWTLDARWTMIFQVPALAALVFAIYRASSIVLPTDPLIPLIATIWFSLHTATSVALWLPTVGQTCGAALGVGLGMLVWRATHSLVTGQPISRALFIQIIAVGIIGPHVKETYYGWTASVGLAIVLVWAYTRIHNRNSRPATSWLKLEVATVLPPLIHFVARMFWGGLSAVVEGSEGRYHAAFGMNVISNMALSLAGALASAPVHYVRSSTTLRWIGCAGVVLSGVLFVAGFARRSRGSDRQVVATRSLAVVVGVSFFALTITWPTERISELYLMGPNAGISVAIAIGTARLWRARGGWQRLLGRSVTIAAFAIGSLGLVSRALHFRTSWLEGRNLYAEIAKIQAGLGHSVEDRTICLDARLERGPAHSQYVMPPANALNPEASQDLLNRLRPNRRIKILRYTRTFGKFCDDYLTGKNLPKRIDW